MQFEVEQKHRVHDERQLLGELAARGVTVDEARRYVDTYYNHPQRDFAQTDEALRIRRVGNTNAITYKGPKVDRTTKTRRELELPFADGETGAAQFGELLEALGFTPVAEVVKLRRSFQIPYSDHEVIGTVDKVEGLGTFVELELTADDAELDRAQQVVKSLAEELQLGPSERRSYLEMLLES